MRECGVVLKGIFSVKSFDMAGTEQSRNVAAPLNMDAFSFELYICMAEGNRSAEAGARCTRMYKGVELACGSAWLLQCNKRCHVFKSG